MIVPRAGKLPTGPLVAALLGSTWVAGASAESVQGAAASGGGPPADVAMVEDAGVPQELLLERLQWIVWEDQALPRPADMTGLGAGVAGVLLDALAGAGSAGQDVAKPKK